MIVSFKHKGLKKFFETGNTKGIQTYHANKLRIVLAAINTAVIIEDMNLPQLRLHQLKGDRSETWSVSINGQWRVTFQFYNGDAFILNYEDYH